jgi:hypothetical protein
MKENFAGGKLYRLCPGDEIGKHSTLKMSRPKGLWVRVPPRAQKNKSIKINRLVYLINK